MPVELTPKKKSTFGGLKGLFIQEVPEAQEAAPAVPKPSITVTVPPTPLTPQVNDSVKAALQQALESNRLEEYDYLKFRSALQELAADIPDERLRFKTVFATAKAMGVTKPRLIETAKHYILVLDQELKNFNEALSEQVDTRIVSAEASVKSFDAELDDKHQKIAHLNEEIAALTQKRTELVMKIAQDKSVIDTRKNGFLATHTTMVQDINTDITKLSGYLG